MMCTSLYVFFFFTIRPAKQTYPVPQVAARIPIFIQLYFIRRHNPRPLENSSDSCRGHGTHPSPCSSSSICDVFPFLSCKSRSHYTAPFLSRLNPSDFSSAFTVSSRISQYVFDGCLSGPMLYDVLVIETTPCYIPSR